MSTVTATKISTKIGDVVLRPLSVGDLDRSFFALLSQLTKAPALPRDAFAAYLAALDANPDQVVLVAEADGGGSGALLGTASVLIERKALRGGGKVGHVEDVVVDAAARGASLGKALIDRLAAICEERGCYKAHQNSIGNSAPVVGSKVPRNSSEETGAVCNNVSNVRNIFFGKGGRWLTQVAPGIGGRREYSWR